jgi:hypothetical protein
MGICPWNRIFLQQSCRLITWFGAPGSTYRLANDPKMMNRPPTTAVPAEKKAGCFEDHFKLLFLFSPSYKRAGGHSCFKTATPFRQAAKSIYLIPLIYVSQNTGAARLDYSIVSSPSGLFRRLGFKGQAITAQSAKLTSEHPEFYIQTK